MATCSNSKRGTSSGGETGDIPIAENYGDSLVGKFVTNLLRVQAIRSAGRESNGRTLSCPALWRTREREERRLDKV